MKVLLINGSPRPQGNTARALREMEETLRAEGVDTELIQVGHLALHSCLACRRCDELGRCVFDDIVNTAVPKLAASDGLVIGSPVHYAQAPGALTAFLSRLFYSTGSMDKRMKVGAVIVSARRAGTTATFDELNKFFTIAQMPVVSGRYWNNVFGRDPGECERDAEGMQNARVVARNMAFLIKCVADGKEKYGLPEREAPVATNFVR